MRGTDVDDVWANRVGRVEKLDEVSSYRFIDAVGIVHRAVWRGGRGLGWRTCCGDRVIEKLQEEPVDAVTCVPCLGAGA